MLSLVATHMCMCICVRIPCNWKETRPAIITSPNITQDSSIRLFLSVGKNAPQHTCNIWLRLESFFFIVLVPRKIYCISSSSCFVTLKRFLMFLFLTWEFPHLWLLQMYSFTLFIKSTITQSSRPFEYDASWMAAKNSWYISPTVLWESDCLQFVAILLKLFCIDDVIVENATASNRSRNRQTSLVHLVKHIVTRRSAVQCILGRHKAYATFYSNGRKREFASCQ